MSIICAMEEANLTAKEVCALIGIPFRTLENWLKGKRMPPDYVERLVVAEILRNKKSGE